MIDNLSIAVYTFPMHMLTSLSVDIAAKVIEYGYYTYDPQL